MNVTVAARGSAIAAIDLDGDLRIDLVEADVSAPRVAVALGNGDGTFAPPSYFAVGMGLSNLVVADVDRSGTISIVTLSLSDSMVSVLLGSGNGMFAAGGDCPTEDPHRLAVGDTNGDGTLDLVTSNHFNNSISLLAGNGNGTFGAPMFFGSGLPLGASVANLDSDGYDDVVVAMSTGFDVHRGMPGGCSCRHRSRCSPKPPMWQSRTSTAMAGAISWALKRIGRLDVLLANGPLSFTLAQYDAVGGRMALVDVDRDNKLDVVIVSPYNIAVVLGRGDGTFHVAASYSASSSDPRVLVAGDFDRDHDVDLATADEFRHRERAARRRRVCQHDRATAQGRAYGSGRG